MLQSSHAARHALIMEFGTSAAAGRLDSDRVSLGALEHQEHAQLEFLAESRTEGEGYGTKVEEVTSEEGVIAASVQGRFDCPQMRPPSST